MISWEHLVEFAAQPLLRRRLRDAAAESRFDTLRVRYRQLVQRMPAAQGEAGSAGHYEWSRWAGELRSSFEGGVPLSFLDHPVLRHTMVFSRRRGIRATARRIELMEAVLAPAELSGLLREDYIGLPTITSAKYLTSANRSHHGAHLAAYTNLTGDRAWDSGSILEWGGGYGNMARIIRRIAPRLTYVIVDLPELLALQYIYLGSLEGEQNVRLVDQPGDVKPGVINLVPSQIALDASFHYEPDLFLSTFALTESPPDAQQYVLGRNFFGAPRLLLGVMTDANNRLDAPLRNSVQRMPLPGAMGVGQGNEYWCR